MELYLLINDRASAETIEVTPELFAKRIFELDKENDNFTDEFWLFESSFGDYTIELREEKFGEKFAKYARVNYEKHETDIENIVREAWEIYKKLVQEASK